MFTRKPKLLLIAYRAVGDHIYWSPLIPILTEKYDVYLETSTKGYALFHDDPRFKKIALFTDFENKPRSEYDKLFQERWAKIREQVKPDLEINLNGTLEVECIGEQFQSQFWLPVGERRAFYGNNGFCDTTFKRAGIEVPTPFEPNGMWFSAEQTANCEKWREKHKDDFVVILPLAGSTAQKVVHTYRDICQQILDKYDNAVIYLAGDETCRSLVFDHPRVKTMIGNDVSIKQAVHRTKYADMVIGPETFLLAAAGMFGTPKIIMATTSSVWQMTQHHKNDFSIQAPIHCSPCHRAIYMRGDCENEVVNDKDEFQATACMLMFRTEDILERVGYVYDNLTYRQRAGQDG